MAGTVEGGRKAAATNKQRYGLDFYRGIGRRGGFTNKGYVIQALVSFDPEVKRVWKKENGK